MDVVQKKIFVVAIVTRGTLVQKTKNEIQILVNVFSIVEKMKSVMVNAVKMGKNVVMESVVTLVMQKDIVVTN